DDRPRFSDKEPEADSRGDRRHLLGVEDHASRDVARLALVLRYTRSASTDAPKRIRFSRARRNGLARLPAEHSPAACTHGVRARLTTTRAPTGPTGRSCRARSTIALTSSAVIDFIRAEPVRLGPRISTLALGLPNP